MKVLEYNKLPCIGKSRRTGSIVKFLSTRGLGVCLKVGNKDKLAYPVGEVCLWDIDTFDIIKRELKYRYD